MQESRAQAERLLAESLPLAIISISFSLIPGSCLLILLPRTTLKNIYNINLKNY